VLHLPCYICIGTLALLLVIQHLQNNRTSRGLLDRILESKGAAVLPDEHPIVDMISKLTGESKEPLTEMQKRLIKNSQQRVNFKIPGMPEFKTK
jgi:hypothetical protein